MVSHHRIHRRRAAAYQAFVHGIQDIAVIRLDGPCEQPAEVFIQHVVAFRFDGARIVVAHQLAGGAVKQIRCLGRGVVLIFPAGFAQHILDDVAVIDNPRFPGACNRACCRAGERVIAGVTVHPFPAATVHRRADHDFAWLYALSQHRIDRVIGGVVGVWLPGGAIQCRLMAQFSIAPAAVVVVAHQEDVVDILLRGVVVHVFNLIAARTDRGGQLVSPARFSGQLVQHLTQVVHQRGVGGFIGLRVTQRWVLAAAAREFPVDIDAVEHFPGLQELFNRGDEAGAQFRVIHLEERIGQRPAAYGRQDLQIRMRLFHRHQLTVVTFVRLVPAGYALLRLLQRRPGVMDSHGIIRASLTGAFQRFQRP